MRRGGEEDENKKHRARLWLAPLEICKGEQMQGALSGPSCVPIMKLIRYSETTVMGTVQEPRSKDRVRD